MKGLVFISTLLTLDASNILHKKAPLLKRELHIQCFKPNRLAQTVTCMIHRRIISVQNYTSHKLKVNLLSTKV
jgi:hypothetical protein